MSKRKAALMIAVIAGIGAIVAPIAVALYLSKQQSIAAQEGRAALIAGEALRRSETCSDQVFAAFKRLEATDTKTPCSASNIALMRDIAASSSHLEDIGYISGDRLMCSSFGTYGAGIPVGPATYLSRSGAFIRPSVSLPFAQDANLLIATKEESGYAALVPPDLPIDVIVDIPDIAIGVVGFTSKELILHRGAFNPDWIRSFKGDSAALFDGEYAVAMARSQTYDYVAFAAVPASEVAQTWRRLAMLLAPIGLGTGIILALAVVRVAQQQSSLPVLMRRGLRRKEFFLVYQPIVDLQTGKWIGAEALMRWRRDDGETVAPDIFIPIAEQSELIYRITDKLIELVSRETDALIRRRPDFYIGLNVSGADLNTERIVDLVRDTMDRSGLRANNILIEATESVFLDTTIRAVHDVRAMGVRIAMDDFGTGYSNLSYLTRLNVDCLKIDKSFIDAVGSHAATSDVVMHIIDCANTLKLTLIAEGVETEAQAHFLRSRGVPYAQGWLFAKPMGIGELAQALEVHG